MPFFPELSQFGIIHYEYRNSKCIQTLIDSFFGSPLKLFIIFFPLLNCEDVCFKSKLLGCELARIVYINAFIVEMLERTEASATIGYIINSVMML
jgi:hypothetical protein